MNCWGAICCHRCWKKELRMRCGSGTTPSRPLPRLISTIFRRVGNWIPGRLKRKISRLMFIRAIRRNWLCVRNWRIKRNWLRRFWGDIGAIEINPPLLYLPVSTSELQAQTYSVLDDSGQRLNCLVIWQDHLPGGFGTILLQLKGPLKRFTVDRVFRKISQVSGGQPVPAKWSCLSTLSTAKNEHGCRTVWSRKSRFDSIKLLLPGEDKTLALEN